MLALLGLATGLSSSLEEGSKQMGPCQFGLKRGPGPKKLARAVPEKGLAHLIWDYTLGPISYASS